MSQRAMSIDNISFLSPPMSNMTFQYDDYEKEADSSDIKDSNERFENMEINSTCIDDQTRYMDGDDDIEEENNIIPWKKLLRKTNSRLNLIS